MERKNEPFVFANDYINHVYGSSYIKNFPIAFPSCAFAIFSNASDIEVSFGFLVTNWLVTEMGNHINKSSFLVGQICVDLDD